MVKQQGGFRVLHQLRYFARELAVWNFDSRMIDIDWNADIHRVSPDALRTSAISFEPPLRHAERSCCMPERRTAEAQIRVSGSQLLDAKINQHCAGTIKFN